jgi:hypothetical protein
MRRPGSLVITALVVVAGSALPGCQTDEPRRTDDAGALAAATQAATSPTPEAAAAPAASAAPAVDAGLADAAGFAVPVVQDVVDAGHVGDAPLVPAGGAATGASGIGKPVPIGVDPIQITIFNRILAKAKTRDLNPGQVQELAEQLTKQKVERTRRTAGTFWLIQFAPTTPPRGKAEQQSLIEQLKAGGDFEFVEADQIMTTK